MNSHSIIPPKMIINKKVFLFIYSLLKSILIFDKENRKNKNDKLDEMIKEIKDKYKIELKRVYSKESFENIIKYVKTQNIKYPGEILENILLRLFTSIMHIPQNETINKTIYSNLENIFNIKNKTEDKQKKEIDEIKNYIIYDKLLPNELKEKEIFFQPYSIIFTDLEYFLSLIYKLKIESIKNNNINKEKIYNRTSYILYKNSLKNPNNKEEKNILQNSLISFENNIDKLIEKKKNFSSIISYFFFTLFLNYQTINSRLIEFCKNNKNTSKYSSVPYEYNLIGSSMKGYYAILVSSSMRQDNRIKKILMEENDLMELGMSELGKTIIFNPYIKSLNYNKNKIFSYYFYYFNKSSGIFENNTIEEVNFYNNFIKDDANDYLCDIINKFKNLKILNISNNKIGSGIGKFLNRLKLLYRQKKTKLENLNINKSYLDSYSLYELCECLKSKYCKLKCLYLSSNNINDYNAKLLFNAIKKNNSLKKLYLGRNYIGNGSTDSIGKVISRFNDSLEVLYLNQNEIRNNDNLLRIASRTKIIYSEEEKANKVLIDLSQNHILKNLDISKIGVNIRNKNQVLLLKNVLNDTYLSCLDFSVILKEYKNLNELEKSFENYKKEVDKFEKDLSKIKEQKNKLLVYIEEFKIIQNKYKDKFDQYIKNKELNNILEETIKGNNIFLVYEDIDNQISKELLGSIGITENDLFDDDNYHLVINLIKYMLLYKISGSFINQWFKGINKCMVII